MIAGVSVGGDNFKWGRTMSKRFAYDYYTVEVPDDLGTEEERIEQVFMEAGEKATLYAIPCEWEYIGMLDGEKIRIRRKRVRRS